MSRTFRLFRSFSMAGQRLMSGAVLSGLLLSSVIYILRFDHAFGLMIDDAWYLLLAKSLATGQGYQLINSPTPGILPLYPPGYPFLLSIFYRLYPHFPENIWLLKSVSVAAMMGTGAISYLYFHRYRGLSVWHATGIAVASVLCPPLVSLATSTLMSECVFTLVLIATILVVEESVRAARAKNNRTWFLVAASAMLATYAFLLRSIA